MRNFPGGGNMKKMMKEMQKLQKDMQESQEAIENEEFEVSVGGGVVKLTINGKKEVLSMDIDPDVVDSDDIETLTDLIIAAVNQGITTAEEKMNESMGKYTQGLNLPGMF